MGKMKTLPMIMEKIDLGENAKDSTPVFAARAFRYRMVPDPDNMSMEHGTCVDR